MSRSIAVGLLLLLVGACSGDSTGPETGTVVSGSYELLTVNGSELPASVASGSRTLVTRGTLTLETSGRFSHTIEFDGTGNLNGTGAWRLDDGVATLDYDQEQFTTEQGSVSEGRFTIFGPFELVYERVDGA